MGPFVRNVQKRQIYRDRKQVARAGREGEEWGRPANGYIVSWWDDKNILKLDCGDNV